MPVLLVMGALAGCTDTPASPAEPATTEAAAPQAEPTVKSDEQVAAEWAAAFAAAREAATSDFEREVLADGVITEAEYDEAVQRYVACVNDRLPAEFAGGYHASKNRFGFYGYVAPPMTDDQYAAWNRVYHSASDACRVGTTAQVEELFVGLIVNPRRLTPDEQILDCLKRHGMVAPSYTMASFQADLVANFGENAVSAEYDPSQATGLDLDTEQATACRVTPWV